MACGDRFALGPTYEGKRGSYATTVFGGLDTTGNATLTSAKLSILRPQAYTARDKDGSVSGRANISYEMIDGIFGYASVARGFESGGSTCRACRSTPPTTRR